MKNKIISIFILVTMLVVTFAPRPVIAGNFVFIDGYKFEIFEDSGSQAKLLTVLENGDKVYATYNKEDGDINMEVVEYATHFLGVGLGQKEVTEYEVQVDELSYENIEATVVNTTTNEVAEITEELDVVQSQAVLALPVVAVGVIGALLKALLLLTASLVISGVTYYVVTSVISRLRKNQPSVKHYKAVIRNGNVYIGQALTSDAAATAHLKVSTGNNVFSYSAMNAKNICATVSPVKLATANPEKHGDSGYYWHYHPRKNATNVKEHLPQHCWY